MPRTYIRRPGERVRGDTRTRFYVPKWVDPYFWIQGSSIEKMVMAEFIRREIYFQHTPQSNPLPWFPWMLADRKKPQTWEPDFLLPQHKIWIEIQGAYFHTQKGQMQTDALRFAWIEAVGWKPIAWWEDDIRTRLPELFDAVPAFYNVKRARELAFAKSHKTTKGEIWWEGGDGIDHLTGLRKALRGRARPPQNIVNRVRQKRKPK